eukprot:TRINITY_DN76177_c0_g1_i1.p2 TRINITY_DN76177_c0_g1~~TRINITY_DN76177_c0_g1_i1.p2  ORF type:complete len:117 (-),score=23.39 TRINITY_DN76177_c0_g1_i1:28-378(-)
MSGGMAAAQASIARGTAATFIWAMPQVCRDGFTCFAIDGEDDVQAFDDVIFPMAIGREASLAPAFSTQIVESPAGHERRYGGGAGFDRAGHGGDLHLGDAASVSRRLYLLCNRWGG